MPELTPTAEHIALLRHVDNRLVLTNEHDNQVYLDITDPPVDVTTTVLDMQGARWIWEPADSLVWELTGPGRDVMERGAP